MEQILLRSTESQLMIIKQKLQSIPVCRRTERLHAWIAAATHALPSSDAYSDEEKKLYQQLSNGFVQALSEGRVKDDDLKLAAKIAAGGLSGHAAISYLFHAFFEMESKKARGLQRVCSTPREDHGIHALNPKP